MNPRVSSGILIYRKKDDNLQVFLVHHGGPFWKNKDEGSWSIPKGEINEKDGNDLFKTAIRELKEETGIHLNKEEKDCIFLGSVTQKAGKVVHCWACEGDWSGVLTSNYIKIQYPYKSGKFISVPEVDKADFFSIDEAKKKINPAQIELIDRLVEKLNSSYSNKP